MIEAGRVCKVLNIATKNDEPIIVRKRPNLKFVVFRNEMIEKKENIEEVSYLTCLK